MVTRRRTRPKQRVLPHIFDIPEGLEDLVHDDDVEDITEQGDTDDYVDGEDDDPTKKKRKKKKKKKRKKKKRKGKKRKNKNKDRDKKGKGKKGSRDNDSGRKVNTPGSFEVVSQKIRTKADGSQVVDVIVDVDKIGRADKYEFRVTMKDTGKTTVQGEQA